MNFLKDIDNEILFVSLSALIITLLIVLFTYSASIHEHKHNVYKNCLWNHTPEKCESLGLRLGVIKK